MITLGIDLASQPKNTAAAIIRWSGSSAVAELHECCTDATLHQLIDHADSVGIDAPLGWPKAFREAVKNWSYRCWDNDLRDQLTLRHTDMFVRKLQRGRPLSVSSDQIAIPAMRAMALLHAREITDRSGSACFYEVYPRASLVAWDLSPKGYKPIESVHARFTLLKSIRERIPGLLAGDDFAATSDNLDALIASLTTRNAAMSQTHLPPLDLRATAQEEGWIHVPTAWPACGCVGTQPERRNTLISRQGSSLSQSQGRHAADRTDD